MIDSTYVAIIGGMATQAGVGLYMAGKFKAAFESIQEWKDKVDPVIVALDKKIDNHDARLNGLEADSWGRHRTR